MNANDGYSRSLRQHPLAQAPALRGSLLSKTARKSGLRMQQACQLLDPFDHARPRARTVAVGVERVHPVVVCRRDGFPPCRAGQGIPLAQRRLGIIAARDQEHNFRLGGDHLLPTQAERALAGLTQKLPSTGLGRSSRAPNARRQTAGRAIRARPPACVAARRQLSARAPAFARAGRSQLLHVPAGRRPRRSLRRRPKYRPDWAVPATQRVERLYFIRRPGRPR